MNQRKSHISPWVTLLLAVVIIGCILAATGVSYARYREKETWDREFSVRENGTVLLGIVRDGVFTQEESAWQSTPSGMQLQFAVSNGKDTSAYQSMDQKIRLRVIGSLGAWSEDSQARLVLTAGQQTYTAEVTRIQEGSALHKTFGDGWIFTFPDAKGDEACWTLPGDTFSYKQMYLSLEGTAMTDTSLLQLQVIGEGT